MSDKDNAKSALFVLISVCNAAVEAIDAANGEVDHDLKDLDHSALNVIHKDFLSLLSLIYASTTKLALSLKPSAPAYKASIIPVNDLATHVERVSQNVRLVRTEHGLTLLKEFKNVAKSVVTALCQLVQILLDQANRKSSTDDTYLSKTGEVHHAIETARAPQDGLSTSNHVAVRKIWEVQQGSLADVLNELKEISQESNSEGLDEFDDGWDELGLDAPKITPEELERLKKMEPIVKLSTLLHKYVIKRLLLAPFDTLPIETPVQPILDKLAEDSAALSAAVDDLASTAHAPQDTEEMSEQLQKFATFMKTLASRVDFLLSLPSVSELLKGSGKETSAKKWFDTCFDQLTTSVKQLSDLLDAQ